MTREDIILNLSFLSVDSTPEEVGQALGRVAAFKEAAYELDRMLKGIMLEWVEHNGPQVIGETRYYAGTKKTTKCKSNPATLDAILQATGGDMESTANLLASQPFKHGACKQALGDKWGEYFEVVEEPELKEGKPTKSLQSINTRFLKGKEHDSDND